MEKTHRFTELYKEIFDAEERFGTTDDSKNIGAYNDPNVMTYFHAVLQFKVLGDGSPDSLGTKAGQALADAASHQKSTQSERQAARNILINSMITHGAIDSASSLNVPGLGSVFSREEWTEQANLKKARKSWLYVWRNEGEYSKAQ